VNPRFQIAELTTNAIKANFTPLAPAPFPQNAGTSPVMQIPASSGFFGVGDDQVPQFP